MEIPPGNFSTFTGTGFPRHQLRIAFTMRRAFCPASTERSNTMKTLLEASTGRTTNDALFARGLNAALADGANLKRIMWMPEGTHQIVCKHKDGFAAVTVRVDAATAATAQKSFSELLEAEAPQKPFCDAFHDHNAATLWPTRFGYEAGRGVLLDGEPTKYGTEMIEGKTCRTFSPGFYTDAKIEATGPKRYGVKPGQRGSPQNPAAVTGVAFYVGSLVNDPAFKDMEAFFASNAENQPGGTPPKGAAMTEAELAAKKAAEEKQALEAENARLQKRAEQLEAENKKRADALQAQREAQTEKALQGAIGRGAIPAKDDKALGRYRDLAKSGADVVEIIDALPGRALGGRLIQAESGEHSVAVGDIGLKAAGKSFLEARGLASLKVQEYGSERAFGRAFEATGAAHRIFEREIRPLLAKDPGIRLGDFLEAADNTDANAGTLTGTLVLQQSLEFLRNILFPVSRISTDMSAAPIKYGETVMTRLRNPLGVQVWDPAQKKFVAKSAPSTQDVPVVINQFIAVPIEFTADILGSTMRNLFEEQSEPMAVAIAEYVNAAIIANITAGNFTNAPVTIDLATFAGASLPSIKLALTKAKVPLTGRTLLLLSDAHDKLLEDEAFLLRQAIKAIKTGQTNAIAGTSEDYALDVFESQIMTDGAKLVGFGHGQSALCFASRIPADYSKVWGDLPPTGVIDLVTDPISGITMMMARYVLHDSWAADARTALMFGTAPGQTKAGVRVVTK